MQSIQCDTYTSKCHIVKQVANHCGPLYLEKHIVLDLEAEKQKPEHLKQFNIIV